MTERTYRGWSIAPGDWPGPKWTATAPDFDVDYRGPEDGWVALGSYVTADSYDAVIAQIDAVIEEAEA